jgi:hypothetical protein
MGGEVKKAFEVRRNRRKAFIVNCQLPFFPGD